MYVRWQLFPCGNCIQDVHVFSTDESALADARSNRKYCSLAFSYRWSKLQPGEAFGNVTQLTRNQCAPPDQQEVDHLESEAAKREREEEIVLGDEIEVNQEG